MFYDGKIRPELNHDYSDEDNQRICLNCEKRFGLHSGYDCPDSEENK